MMIEQQLSDDSLLKLLGARLAGLRLAKNLTQSQLAEQAGLGLRTVQRWELGAAATQLAGFVRICRVLDLLERLDAFIPEPAVSPLAQLKLQGRRRRRASGKPASIVDKTKWTWADTS